MPRLSSRVRSRGAVGGSFLGRLLNPIDLLSETIYSILILLTFTLAFGIIRGDSGQPVADEYVNELFIAALGATIAWGVIDGIMYVLLSMFERSQRHRFLRHIQATQTNQEGVAIIADEFDYILDPIIEDNQRHLLYQDLLGHLRTSQPQPVGLRREDFIGALASVLVAMIAVFPSLVPLMLLRSNYVLAIRVSNIVSFIVLFLAGYQWGKYTGSNPRKTGLLLVATAVIMVLIAIPLGG